MTAHVDQMIEEIINTEGDYVDHPSDRGGPTRWGITEKVARANGYHGDMRTFPKDMARTIYREQYYQNPGFNRVAAHSERIAEELTDTGVNMGPGVAITFLQRSLNSLNLRGTLYQDIAVDGYIGNQTIAALRVYLQYRGDDGERVLVVALNCLQAERYISIAENRVTQEDFIYGWLLHRVSKGLCQ